MPSPGPTSLPTLSPHPKILVQYLVTQTLFNYNEGVSGSPMSDTSQGIFTQGVALLLMIRTDQVLLTTVIPMQTQNSSAIEVVYFISFYNELYLNQANELADSLTSQAFQHDLILLAGNVSAQLKYVYENVQLQLPILTLTIGSHGIPAFLIIMRSIIIFRSSNEQSQFINK